MKRDKLIRIYLQDHDALALITARLIRRSHSSNKGSALGALLEDLEKGAEQDRRELREVMKRLGVRPNPFKRLVAWLAERGGRVKLNGRVLGYSPLSRVFELEGLAALLTMRIARWEALAEVADRDDRLAAIAFADRISRAQQELTSLENQRRAAARTAF